MDGKMRILHCKESETDTMAFSGNTQHCNGFLMWQQDIRAIVLFIKECMDAHSDPGPLSQAFDQP